MARKWHPAIPKSESFNIAVNLKWPIFFKSQYFSTLLSPGTVAVSNQLYISQISIYRMIRNKP